MKQLIITEKPSVAEDLAKALGGFTKESEWFERDDAIIASAAGHLVELDVPEAETAARGFQGLPILPQNFSLKPSASKTSKLNVLLKLMKRSDVNSLMNACDAGREGELIFGFIAEYAGCMKPVTRMWAQTMTKEGLRAAYVNARPAEERAGLMAAARCRAEGDWLVGINGSRASTELRSKAVGTFESQNVGRVQTPTLAIVVHREREIQTFTSQPFWEVGASFTGSGGLFKAKLINPEYGRAADAAGDGSNAEASATKHRFFDKAAAQALLNRCSGAPVDKVTQDVTDTLRAPPTLFDLTTLQREANTRFKFTAKKTLEIAQRLYEKHKMTTYPRTDSIALPEDYVETVKTTLNAFIGSPWDGEVRAIQTNDWVDGTNKRIFNDQKISDHFAIIPTGHISSLDADELKIFELITRRFIAAFYPAAKLQKTTRLTTVAGIDFFSSGTVIVDPGWMKVIKETDADGNVKGAGSELAKLEPEELPNVESIGLIESKTTPPSRFTEAALLAAMETAGKSIDDEELRQAMKDSGLGTPATRASIIEGLCDDGKKYNRPKEPYLRRQDNHFIPSDKAMELVEFLERCGASFLTTAATTGQWEAKLAVMSKSGYERGEFMQEIRNQVTELIETLRVQEAKIVVQSTPLNTLCPKCKTAKVGATKGSFVCLDGCGFSVRRVLIGRTMSDAEMTEILNGNLVGPLTGFYSTTKNKKFDAYVKLGDGKFDLVFPGQDGAPVTKLKCECPKCGGDVISKPKVVECEDCKFVVFRSLSHREFSDDEFEQLLSTGKLPILKGFKSKDGKKMEAGCKLSLEDGRVSLVFPGGADLPFPKLDCSCPRCGGSILSKPSAVECEGCKLVIYRTIAQRKLSDAELTDLLKKGKTKQLNGFISSKGRAFAASVTLSKTDGKTGFEFPPKK